MEDGNSEEETTESILKHANSAAGILCQLKIHHQIQASNVPWMNDVIGVVATLGKLVDDSLSRLLAAYLGIETMLAVVCKTETCVNALETYNRDGSVDKSSGLHGLGTSIGRSLDDPFLVICLENMRLIFSSIYMFYNLGSLMIFPFASLPLIVSSVGHLLVTS